MTASFSDPRRPRALIALLRTETADGFWRLCVFIIVAATGNVVLLIALSQVVAAGPGGPIGRYAVLYCLAFTLFLYAQRESASEIAAMGEDAIAALRMRMALGMLAHDEQTRDTAFRIASTGHLQSGASALSRDLPYAATAAQAVATAILALVFIAALSPPAFILAVIALAGGAILLNARRKLARRVQQTTTEREAAAHAALAKLARPPDDSTMRLSLYENTLDALADEAEAKADLGRRRFEAGAFAAMLALAVAPIAAFVLPHASEAGQARMLIIFLFLAAPVIALVDAMPALSRLEQTAEELLEIRGHFEEDGDEEEQIDSIQPNERSS